MVAAAGEVICAVMGTVVGSAAGGLTCGAAAGDAGDAGDAGVAGAEGVDTAGAGLRLSE